MKQQEEEESKRRKLKLISYHYTINAMLSLLTFNTRTTILRDLTKIYTHETLFLSVPSTNTRGGTISATHAEGASDHHKDDRGAALHPPTNE